MAKRFVNLTTGILLLGVLFSILFPNISTFIQDYNVYLLSAIMVLSLFGIKMKHIFHIPKREIVFAFVIHYAWIPLVSWMLISLFIRDPNQSLGILLAVVMPVGVTAPAIVRLMKGSFDHALALTVLFFVTSIFISPFMLKLLAGVSFSVDPFMIIKPMALYIIIPIALSLLIDRLMTKFAKKSYAKLKTVTPKISLFLLFLIIWGVSGKSLMENPYATIWLLLFIILLFILVFFSILLFSGLIVKAFPDEIALTMLMYKNYVLALVLASQLFPASAFAVVVFSFAQNIATAFWMFIIGKTRHSVWRRFDIGRDHLFRSLRFK